jgi:hypothetical protein
MGDFNENITSNSMVKFFAHFNMIEAITCRHSAATAPNTYEHGTDPIDGIFVSANIEVLQAGYTPISWGARSDHRCLWIDIASHSTFGTLDPPTWKPAARRLTMLDPRVVAKFNHYRTMHAKSHNLLESVRK